VSSILIPVQYSSVCWSFPLSFPWTFPVRRHFLWCGDNIHKHPNTKTCVCRAVTRTETLQHVIRKCPWGPKWEEKCPFSHNPPIVGYCFDSILSVILCITQRYRYLQWKYWRIDTIPLCHNVHTLKRHLKTYRRQRLCIFGPHDAIQMVIIHFAWGIAEAKCVLVTAICVCLCVCLSVPHHIPTLLHGPGCNVRNGRGAL